VHGRELLVLRDEAARNRAEVSRLRHEAQVAAARDQAVAAANTEHLRALEEELTEVLSETREVEAERSGPTVPREALANAEDVLECRRDELRSVQRDVETLEAVIRAHVDDPKLNLRATLEGTHPQLLAVMGLAQ
jgi:chromosome segregation ATPase